MIWCKDPFDFDPNPYDEPNLCCVCGMDLDIEFNYVFPIDGPCHGQCLCPDCAPLIGYDLDGVYHDEEEDEEDSDEKEDEKENDGKDSSDTDNKEREA